MQQYPERRDQLPKPLEGVARELERASSERSDVLAADIKQKQRAMLMAHAERMMTSQTQKDVTEPTKQQEPVTKKTPWFAWGGFALAGALAVVAIVFTSNDILKPSKTLQALRIPSAHAQDAFTVFAEKKDAQGVTIDSAFALESKVPVSEQVLKDALTIYPAIQYDLEKSTENNYRIVPKEPLKEGEVYKVSITTIVDGDTPTKREFSWALQTKQRFAVLSMIPRDGGADVPVSSSIEFQLTQSGFAAPSPEDFTITPKVEGSFEIRGRTLTFVPKKPLAPETIYRAVLSKDFASSTGLGELPSDINVRFETQSIMAAAQQAGTPNALPDLSIFPQHQYTTVPTSTLTIDIGYRYGNQERGYNEVEVVGYELTAESALEVARIQAEMPSYARYYRSKPETFASVQKTKTFTSKIQVAMRDTYQEVLPMPTMAKGMYLVSFTPIALNSAQKVKTTWSFIQVTDTAVYSTVDRDGMYLWAIDAGSNRPLGNAPVRKGQENYRTNEEGIAKLSTPTSFLPSSEVSGEFTPYVILTIGEGKSAVIHTIQTAFYRPYDAFTRPGYVFTGHNRTMSFLASDRALTRPTDHLDLFGLARDRDEKKGVGEVKVRLTNPNYFYSFRDGEAKIYAETSARTDDTGRFTASLDWKDLAPGYYALELVLPSNEIIATQSLEIEDFVKPTYTFQVTSDRNEYVAGDTVKVQAKVAFIDGTPVRNVKFNVQSAEDWLSVNNQIQTDESGIATIEVPTQKQDCEVYSPDRYNYCSPNLYASIYVRPAEGEEALMESSVSPIIYRSKIDLQSTIVAQAGSASGTLRSFTRDFSVSPAKLVPSAQGVTMTVYPKYYEKVERSRQYDPINKVTYPVYDYVMKVDAPIVQQLQTNAEGVVAFNFPLRSDRYYEVAFEARDQDGRLLRENGYVSQWDQAIPRYGAGDSPSPSYPELTFSEPKRVKESKGDWTPTEYDRNEEITATIRQDNKDYDVSKTPGILTVIASRGIQSFDVDTTAKTSFRFEDRLIPTAMVTKVTFNNGKFVVVRGTVQFSTDLDELAFDLKAKKDVYAPGEQVEVEVIAKHAFTKERVSDVLLNYVAVDQAIIELGGGVTINPIKVMYSWVADEILSERSTHGVHNQYGGGAEMGGGGGDFAKLSVRSDFKDVAASGMIRTDDQGVATVSFKAPDNLTSWKLRIMGVSDRLQAGAGTLDIPVRKPAFVDVVVPATVLQADKPTIKLRAFGGSLTNGEEVQFQIDAPTLGINKQTYKGKVGESLTLGLERNDLGKHRLEIGVVTSKGSDALERFITIIPSRIRSIEQHSIEAYPGAPLKEATTPETIVSFVSKGKGMYYSDVLDLAWQQAIRADRYVAQYMAYQWLGNEYGETYYQEELEELKQQFKTYLNYDGLVRLKNYGSSDPLLTSDVVATAPELLNKDELSRTFWNALDTAKSRTEQIAAIAGLAGIGEAVIPELDQLGAIEDLSARERLIVARSMELAGNREAAKTQLDKVLQNMKTQDKLAWIEVEKNETESIEMTADAAALAMKLADPRAPGLKEYVDTHWTDATFPVLAKARYIKAGLATAYSRDIVLKYTLGGEEKELVFNSTRSAHELRLTRDEVNAFRVTSVNGPIQINQTTIVGKRPESTPGITLTRRIEQMTATGTSLDALQEGDRVKVTLDVQWDAKAQSGCYIVKDFLPSNMRAVHTYMDFSDTLALTKSSPQESHIVMCHDGNKAQSSRYYYTARVISRGAYVAEAPIMQHADYPTIATNGKDETITVK